MTYIYIYWYKILDLYVLARVIKKTCMDLYVSMDLEVWMCMGLEIYIHKYVCMYACMYGCASM